MPVMPHQENTSQSLASNTYNAASKSNFQNLTTLCTNNSAVTGINKQEPTKQQDIPARLQHRKACRSSQSRQGSMWRDRAVNASAHEVPSGPNPISNR